MVYHLGEESKSNHIYNLRTLKVDRGNGLNTHLHDAHIDMNLLKFVILRIYNDVQMCRKQNYHCSPHVNSDWTVYNTS